MPRFHVHRYRGLRKVHVRGEAIVAQLQTELVFAFRTKTAVALVAGANPLVVCLFLGVDFGMNFDHCKLPPILHGKSLAMATD